MTEHILLKFLHLSEGLKKEFRNGRTSDGNHESVADHSWRISLMVFLFSPYLDQSISIEKALKMAIVHDLAELLTGDKPYFTYEGKEELENVKYKEELTAMQKIKTLLPEELGNEFLDLWKEFEEGITYEAKFVKALDKMEAQIQHNEMNYSYWNDFDKKYAMNRLDKHCSFDSFLQTFKGLVQEESHKKMLSCE